MAITIITTTRNSSHALGSLMPPDFQLGIFYSKVSASDEDHLLSQDFHRLSTTLDWRCCPRRVQHVSIDYSEDDYAPWGGSIILFLYIGIWLIGALVIPAVIVLLILGFYISGGILSFIISLCYLVPIQPNQQFRDYVRIYFGRYFKQASVRLEHVPDPLADRPTVFCISPHGVFSISWAHCYLTKELNHVYFCFSSLLRLNPFLRVITLLTGNPSGISKKTVINHMKNGRSIAIIPGAWHEATLHNPEVDRVYIKKRQGFIKYALEYGCTITPTYCFGEKKTYTNIQGGYRFRFWLNDRKILATLPWGRPWCFFLPRPESIHTVVGTPIELPHIPNPTRDDVNKWHQVYINEMVELYDRYKVQFYGEDGKKQVLEIW